jgi:hypothetical protein
MTFKTELKEAVAEVLNEVLPGLLAKAQTQTKPKPTPEALWGVGEIAIYCGFSSKHVREKIITHSRFPQPANGQVRQKRWNAEAVKGFFKQKGQL